MSRKKGKFIYKKVLTYLVVVGLVTGSGFVLPRVFGSVHNNGKPIRMVFLVIKKKKLKHKIMYIYYGHRFSFIIKY